LETIRQFAAERLAETDHDEAAALRAAHCAHYLSVAEAAAPHLTGPEQGKWFTRLDTVQANLRRATEHAAHDPHGTEQVFRFGVALWRYWMARDREQEAAALLLPVLDRPEARADPELFATALSTAALAARSIDIAAALRRGEQAVKLARQLGTSQLLIESLAALSYVCYLAREPERGLPLGREAVESARQLGDDVLLGESLVAYLQCDALTDPRARQTALRRGHRLHTAIRRPSDGLLLDQLCRRSGTARWGHTRRPRSSTTGGTSYAGRRGRNHGPAGQHGLGAAPGQ